MSLRINFAGEYGNAKCTNSVEQIPSRWAVMLCNPVDTCQRCRGTCSLNFS